MPARSLASRQSAHRAPRGEHREAASTAAAGPPVASAVRVRLLLNILWFLLAGLWMALAYALVALLCFVLIVTIPFGVASLRIASFALWPFGRTVVHHPAAGGPSMIGNLIWLVLFGWWLALGHLVTGALLCLTVVGIPLGLANFKLVPVSLWPLGREVMSIARARQLGLPIDSLIG